MPRTMVTEKQWTTLFQLMRSTGRVYNKYEHRMTFDGVLYRMRVGGGEIFQKYLVNGIRFLSGLICDLEKEVFD